jgi:UDP-N-acetylglucosamine 2-epimerase (non-hydrolysing)
LKSSTIYLTIKKPRTGEIFPTQEAVVKVILALVGTRPEVIKMAPVIRELRNREGTRTVVCSTGQHREILDQSMRLFRLKADLDLTLMQANQTLGSLTARLFAALDPVLTEIRPDGLIAQGDTTSVFVAAVLAFYHRIPFFHVEAGLRTGQLDAPFPEEFNRRAADMLASLMFAPTELARNTLLSEGADPAKVLLTGNTVVDALGIMKERSLACGPLPLSVVDQKRRTVLVTVHRRENFGPRLRGICLAIRNLAAALPNVQFILPVHPNPNVGEVIRSLLSEVIGVSLVPPLAYDELIELMQRSQLILTDSGGIQEEAPSFGVPVFILRDSTERPEGVAAGVAALVGAEQAGIEKRVQDFFADPALRERMRSSTNPYGDGNAARRIADAIDCFFLADRTFSLPTEQLS